MKSYTTIFILNTALTFSSASAKAETKKSSQNESGYSSNEEIAHFGNTTLKRAEFKRIVETLPERSDMVAKSPALRQQYLQHLINTKLLANEAEKQGLENDEDFKFRLAQAKREILAASLIAKLRKDKTTDSALQEYFSKNKNNFSTKEVRASHVILNDEPTAKQVLAEATKPGVNFDDLAKKRGHAIDGALSGDLGFFKRGRMLPEFEEAAFKTPKGEVYSQPVKTSFGWHVLKVTDVKGTDEVDFASVRKEVERAYWDEMEKNLVMQLRDKAKVVVFEEALKSGAL